jgi:hypothetical protein
MVLLLLPEVRVLFDLCLVEAVDDGVFPLGDEYPLDLGKSASRVWRDEAGRAADLLVVLEADLPHGHAAILLEVGPGGVDDGDAVLLVALDGVGLGQLGQVGQQVLRDVLPCLALAQAQVNVCAGQLVDVEL